jgi:small-conductance mechanosensitive channel
VKYLFLIVTFLFALTPQDILKTVPKNSPEYSLDLILVKKIQKLSFNPPVIKKPEDEKEYIREFNRLVLLEKELLDLPKKIKELQEKLEILKNEKTPTAKLQYMYYNKLYGIYNEKLSFLNENLPKYEKELFKALKDIDFDVKRAKENIKVFKKELLKVQKEYEKLNIDLQKWELLNNTSKVQEIKKLISENLKIQQYFYKKLFDNYLVIWLNDLKNKNKKAFEDDDYLLSIAKKLNIYSALDNVINDFEKFAFGSKLLVYNAKKEAELTLHKIAKILNYPLFKVGNRTITPVNFFIFVIVLIIGWFAGKYYKKFIYSLKHRYDISHATATLLANMGYYTIITLSFLIALKIVGLDLSSLAIIAGALSVGIGFGLQNVVNNFVSGIILMFERSIKVGDYIQIDQNTRGEVVDISMRSTIIRTNDNINLIIPNQSFIQNNVINWTLGDDIVRFRVPFSVAYGSDIDKVENVILQALKCSNLHYIKKHPSLDVTPRVVFMQMGDSSLDFELFIWVRGEYARRPRRTRSEFLKMIYKALNEAGIEIPFPQQDLHIRDSVPFEIKIKR